MAPTFCNMLYKQRQELLRVVRFEKNLVKEREKWLSCVCIKLQLKAAA